MSAADWKARTGDAAFVDGLAACVRDLMGAADRGEAAAVAQGIAALRERLQSLRDEKIAATDEAAQAAQAAKVAMTEDCIAGLEAIAVPDPDGIGAWLDGLAESIGWIGAAIGAADGNPALASAAAEADRAAARIAAELAELAPEARQVALAAALPPAGLAVVLEKIAPDQRMMVAADAAAANAAEPEYRDALCRASAARAAHAAAGPAEVLAPDGMASALLAAFAAAPAIAAYVHRVAAAAPADLAGLVAAIEAVAVPSAVSRPASALHAALEERFGASAATEIVRGWLLLRILGPSLPADLTARIARLLGEAPSAADVPADDALILFTEHVVAAGAEAADIAAAGDDPDDIVTMRGNALLGAEELAATFLAPTPPDPLGTVPANPATVLGQAILKARAARPGGYLWSEIQALRESDMDLYLALIEDERAQVMDLIEIPGGLRLDAGATEPI